MIILDYETGGVNRIAKTRKEGNQRIDEHLLYQRTKDVIMYKTELKNILKIIKVIIGYGEKISLNCQKGFCLKTRNPVVLI